MDITLINPRGGESVTYPLDEKFRFLALGFCVRECVRLGDLEMELDRSSFPVSDTSQNGYMDHCLRNLA